MQTMADQVEQMVTNHVKGGLGGEKPSRDEPGRGGPNEGSG